MHGIQDWLWLPIECTFSELWNIPQSETPKSHAVLFCKVKICFHFSSWLKNKATEQHAWRDHLDDPRGEEACLCPNPCSPGFVFHYKSWGIWEVLWKDPDHLSKGNISQTVCILAKYRGHQCSFKSVACKTIVLRGNLIQNIAMGKVCQKQHCNNSPDIDAHIWEL